MEEKTTIRIRELDALRGIAALSVVFFHFTMRRPEYNEFFKLGTTGVDLFFIISGFVILMTLEKVSSGIEFVINRISRLYPTYWTAVILTYALWTFHTFYLSHFNFLGKFTQFLANLTMFQFYLNIPNLDGPYWTLTIEMIFYIFMLVLFQTKLLKHLNSIGITLCLFAVLSSHYLYDTNFIKSVFYWIPLLQFIPLFFAGTVFYKIYSGYGNSLIHYVIIVFCLLCQCALFPYAGSSMDFINQTQYSMVLIVYFAVFTLFVNLKLGFIVNRVTLFLGKISYALYLIHQYISLSFIIPLFYRDLGFNFWVVAIGINLPVIIGIASLITYKIEIPYSRKMKEKLRMKWALRQA